MKQLTRESIEECIAQIKQHVAEQMEPPPHFYIHADLVRIYDRLLNPWKGKRAIWLRRNK